MFHSEPSPTALKFVPSKLLPDFGWAHKNAGIKYSEDEKSFRQTISYGSYSDRGFYLYFDKEDQKICFKFDIEKVSEKHSEWKNHLLRKQVLNLDPYPYWGIDDLYHKLGSKIHNCFLVVAKRKKENGNEYFHYNKIFMLKGLSKEKLIECFLNGKLYVDFDARTGHNHGTKFRIKENSIKDLYSKVCEL